MTKLRSKPEKINQPTANAEKSQAWSEGCERTPVIFRSGGERSEPPCLFRNNSIQNTCEPLQTPENVETSQNASDFSSKHKKAAQTLFANVARLTTEIAETPGHVGFLTLTFSENITDHREAYRRFRSLNTNYLASHGIFGEWICVKEQQKRGAWHYHLVVTMKEDILSGFDFGQYDEWLNGPRLSGTFPTGGSLIKELWAELREELPKYGFGHIFSLEPLRSNVEAISRYVGKYISKHIGQRNSESKGVRLVTYSKGWCKNSLRFSWNTQNAKEWRRKLSLFAKLHGCTELYQLSEKLGPGWAHRYVQDIYDIDTRRTEIMCLADKEYESNTIKAIQRNNKARKAYTEKNLTLHTGKNKKQRKIETERSNFKYKLPSLVDIYLGGVHSAIIEDQIYKSPRKEINKETGEITFPEIKNQHIEGVPF
jgi:hypothetical protein